MFEWKSIRPHTYVAFPGKSYELQLEHNPALHISRYTLIAPKQVMGNAHSKTRKSVAASGDVGMLDNIAAAMAKAEKACIRYLEVNEHMVFSENSKNTIDSSSNTAKIVEEDAGNSGEIAQAEVSPETTQDKKTEHVYQENTQTGEKIEMTVAGEQMEAPISSIEGDSEHATIMPAKKKSTAKKSKKKPAQKTEPSQI